VYPISEVTDRMNQVHAWCSRARTNIAIFNIMTVSDTRS
jgi:hypothetical protein